MSSFDERSEIAFARAARGYERGRRLRAAWLPLLILPASALVATCGTSRLTTLLLGAALAAIAFALRVRGGEYGAGVAPGLVAGAAPLLVPLFYCPMGELCAAGVCLSACYVECATAGLTAGALLGAWLFTHARAKDPRFVASALVVATLAGSMGCVMMGLGGVAGMIAGVVVTTLPSAFVARARA